MTLTVYIGTEDDQLIPQKVLEYSIKKNAKTPVEVRAVKQELERVGGTNFGFVRFLVPSFNNYQGKAIYLDADQLVFSDINELASALDMEHAIGLVNNPKGTFGGKVVGQHNQTSVMVLNCSMLKDWNPNSIFKHVVPNRSQLKKGQIHYRDFMMLSWFNQKKIKPIDPRWNHFNIVEPDTKLTHFSYVRAQPWKNPSHPLTKFWGQWLRKAIRAGAVTRLELMREIMRGAIHKHFILYMI
jgi:lipopolysaccharide biosynthesis glycosyltransferase